MCFTNVNEAGIRYWYFMYSTNKCTDFNKNIILIYKKKKKTTPKKTRGSSPCFTSGTCCVNIVTNPMISHE